MLFYKVLILFWGCTRTCSHAWWFDKHFHHERHMGIWMAKDGGRAERGPKAFEGFVGAGTPGQGLGLSAEQGGQRGCEQTEILDETAIEIGESKESLQFLNRLGSRPFRNCCYLPLVHLDTLLSDDVTEELHRGTMELAFL